ncbi:E3 ubiquitin-protein ligase RNF181 [Diachasma alloeum]|uniref:E3 ubiquitin-protein ligase RNF181 n=1 Tax=Diachasma alloeum TaxID=454923 RepID=UPI0007383671|nr:E3 ubiquitin-protein ligase RNF181 [Diachasma alloeum]
MSDYFEEMGWTPLRDGETPNVLLQMARFLRDVGMWDMLGQDEKLPPPASKAAVEALEEIKITDAGSKQCPVCLKAFESSEIAKSLPCQHSFHKECIIPWLDKTNSCPLCRHELPTDDEDYEMYRKEKLRAVEREKDLETLHNSMFG